MMSCVVNANELMAMTGYKDFSKFKRGPLKRALDVCFMADINISENFIDLGHTFQVSNLVVHLILMKEGMRCAPSKNGCRPRQLLPLEQALL